VRPTNLPEILATRKKDQFDSGYLEKHGDFPFGINVKDIVTQNISACRKIDKVLLKVLFTS
jgi:hypothetical protein